MDEIISQFLFPGPVLSSTPAQIQPDQQEMSYS